MTQDSATQPKEDEVSRSRQNGSKGMR